MTLVFGGGVALSQKGSEKGKPAAKAKGDTKSAVDLHYALHPLVDLLSVETNPAPIKRVLERSGLIASGFVRPPLIPVTERGQRPIEELLVEGLPALEGPPAELARELAGLGPP